MISNIVKSFVAACILVSGISGCIGKHEPDETKIGDELAGISIVDFNSQTNASTKLGRILSLVSGMNQTNRVLQLERVADRLDALPFADGCYGDREWSVKEYLNLYATLCDFAVNSITDKGWAWALRLRPIERLRQELELQRDGPMPEPTRPPMGITRGYGQYYIQVRRQIFYNIRHQFEDGAFGLFFDTIAPEEQEKWISRIEKTAGRKVVISSPKHVVEHFGYSNYQDYVNATNEFESLDYDKFGRRKDTLRLNKKSRSPTRSSSEHATSSSNGDKPH